MIITSSRSSGRFINNGKVNKRVLDDEINDYLIAGWRLGMKPRTEETNRIANKKREETCIKKYGVENVRRLQEVKEKAVQTSITRYGVDNPAKCESVKAKTKETNQRLYPENIGYHNPEKRNETIINIYGSMDGFYKWRTKNTDWEAVIEKQIKTKQENKTINYSQPENDMYVKLCEQYGRDNVIRGYKDDRYPFFCDFYIVSEDLFIELNRHWTHGGHPFNPDSPDDQKKLNLWNEKAKTSKYYRYAVNNWTVRDPLKLKTAIKNNLNYVMRY